MNNLPIMDDLTLSEKNVIVRDLITRLENRMVEPKLTDSDITSMLRQLKVHGRDTRGADAIYSESGLRTLCEVAFDERSSDISQEALRCIANALLLHSPFRAKIVDLGYSTAIAKIYCKQDNKIEFLAARLLFLLTYCSDTDFAELVMSYKLVESIDSHLRRHANHNGEDNPQETESETMAMVETSKLVFNLANKMPAEVSSLSVTVPSLCTLLLASNVPDSPLQGTASTFINALSMLDLESFSTPEGTARASDLYDKTASKLIEILAAGLEQHPPVQLDVLAIPSITVLRKIYGISVDKSRARIREALLPADSDRDLPLGKSTSLPSQLLRLTLFPGLAHLPEAILAFLYEISEQNPTEFISNIGYGYAAGYLMNHKIPVPEGMDQPDPNEATRKIPVNPITGQRLDKELPIDLPEMTPAEKEREAERLFVLFERLKATGVVDVQNPAYQASAVPDNFDSNSE